MLPLVPPRKLVHSPLNSSRLYYEGFVVYELKMLWHSQELGLTVTEGMWKGRAVIGGNVGGICTQIDNGETGYLVDSPEECGERIVSLLKDPTLRARMGAAARERVRRDFLLPRLTLDYLQAARKHTTAQPALNDQGINKIEKPATVS